MGVMWRNSLSNPSMSSALVLDFCRGSAMINTMFQPEAVHVFIPAHIWLMVRSVVVSSDELITRTGH